MGSLPFWELDLGPYTYRASASNSLASSLMTVVVWNTELVVDIFPVLLCVHFSFCHKAMLLFQAWRICLTELSGGFLVLTVSITLYHKMFLIVEGKEPDTSKMKDSS